MYLIIILLQKIDDVMGYRGVWSVEFLSNSKVCDITINVE